MANRNLNWRPNWLTAALGAAIGLVIAGAVVLAPVPVQAVHGSQYPFELDGNAVDTTIKDDWNSVFADADDDGESFAVDAANAPGGKETSSWKGTNKDIDEINDNVPGTDNWEYETSKVVPDKDNITNAYAKAYQVPGYPNGDIPGHPTGAGTHSHLVIYFGADRFANNGDAALGFWFFKNDVSLGSNGQFVGKHAVGDLLVQVDFVSGGRSSEIQIFKWVGSGGDYGSLEEIVPATVANGTTVCSADDSSTPAINEADRACATTNDTPQPSPWAYVPKSGAANTFPSESFYEGGVDITALLGDVCFSAFMAETRSSHSETAELKDFALDDFDLCSVDVEKVCFSDNGATSPLFNPQTELYTTKHTVTITNDGFGPINDIALRDDAVTSTKVCAISSITGQAYMGLESVPQGGTLFPNNTTYVPIADVLEGGDSITVNMVCVTGDNPFTNGVSVRSSPSPGGTADVTDSDAESASVQGDGLAGCTKTLFSGLKLLKFCQGDPGTPQEPNTRYQAGDLSVVLNPNNGYAPQVCVDIALSNTTSSQKMVVNTFSDSDLGSLLPAGGLILEPLGTQGDTYYVSQCYDPVAPDGNQTIPGLAAYSDTVSATGTGKTQPIAATATPKTATCKLCPTCPTCPTP